MFVYTAYFDESGTHSDSTVTVMGGVLARAEQWRQFESKFADIKRHHNFKIFHTKKFKRKTGDFKGWSNEQCLALIAELSPLSASFFTDSVATSLDNQRFEDEYKGGANPKKLRLDTKYGLCFRLCLYHFVAQVLRRRHRKKYPTLHVVLEAGHNNCGDAERIFFEVKAELDAMGCNMLKSITKSEKDECDPLMMADFVAHTTYVMENRNPTPVPSMATKAKFESGSVAHLQFTSFGLDLAKKELIAKLAAKNPPRAS